MNDGSKVLFIAAAIVVLVGAEIDILMKIKQTVPPVAQTNPFKPVYPNSPPAQDMTGHNPLHEYDAQNQDKPGDTAEACIKRHGQPNYLENPKQYLNCYGKVVHGELGDTYEVIP